MKIQFSAIGVRSAEELQANIRHTASLGLKGLEDVAGRAELAVVGGGPSAAEHLEELKQWEGSIWAINGAWKWCQDNGLDATFYSIDPQPQKPEHIAGVKRAVISSTSAPATFELLKDADVRTFVFDGGPTSAILAPLAAGHMGFGKITFFGCESSYNDAGHVHLYDAPVSSKWLRVAVKMGVGHQLFLTDPEFVMQAEVLALLLRTFPFAYSERSGGLLRALVENPDWDAVEISPDLASILKPLEPVSV